MQVCFTLCPECSELVSIRACAFHIFFKRHMVLQIAMFLMKRNNAARKQEILINF